MLSWPVWKSRNKSWLKTRDASSASRWQSKPSATRRVGKELANYEEDPEQVIEHLREQYVASSRQRLKKIEWTDSDWEPNQALLQESSHRQEDLAKAQTNFKTAKEKEVLQLEELDQAHKRWSRPISRIPRAIGKSGAGQSCLPEAQTAMFDLMDESKTNGRGSIAWKPFRRTIVTSMQASRAFAEQNGWEASVGLLVRIWVSQKTTRRRLKLLWELAANRSLSRMKRPQRERSISWNAIAWDGQLSFRSRRSKLVNYLLGI